MLTKIEEIVLTFPNDKWFRKILEEQERMKKLFSPFTDVLHSHQKLLESFGDIQLNRYETEFLNLSVKDHLLNAGLSNDILKIQRDIEQSFGSVSSIKKELEYLSTSSAFSSFLSSHEEIYRLQDQYSALLDFQHLPSERIKSVLATAEATARLYDVSDSFSDYTLSSIAQYQGFVEAQCQHLQLDSDLIAQRRLQVTELSGDIFELSNASLDLGASIQAKSEIDKEVITPSVKGEKNIYGHINQHLGFVYSHNYEGDVNESYKNSTPVKIAQTGFSITEKIYQINTISEHNGKAVIFKPTPQTMRACATLPTIIATNEIGFNFLIDHLFFLIYEGSGTAKRLTNIIESENLEPVWKLKQIRLNARHDINHGSTTEIVKKKEKVNNAFMSLISKPIPIRQRDWQTAQLQLYIEIDIMLQKVIDIIING